MDVSMYPRAVANTLVSTVTEDWEETSYPNKYLFLSAWLMLCLVLWLFCNMMCSLNFPPECKTTWLGALAVESIQNLWLQGFMIAWLCNITVKKRFEKLFCKQRWWFFFNLFLFAVLSAAFSSIPGINDPCCNTAWTIVITFGVVLYIGVVGWHVWYAWHASKIKYEFTVYIMSRSVFLVIYVVSLLINLADPKSTSVINAYIILFSLAVWCQFDHTVSILCFSVILGIWAQTLINATVAYQIFKPVVNCRAVDALDGFPIVDYYTNATAAEPFFMVSCLVDDNGFPIKRSDTPEGMMLNSAGWPYP